MSPDALRCVVGLISLNDRETLRNANMLAELAPVAEWPRIEEASNALAKVWAEFNYFETPEFEKLKQGKSQAVVAMLRKIHSEPVRARETRERLMMLLGTATVADADALLNLVTPNHRELVLRALSLLTPNETGPAR